MTSDLPGVRAATLFRGTRRIRRIVVKLGSGTLTDESLALRESTLRDLSAQVAEAWDRHGVQVAVVTSGAIAAGRRKLGMTERPRTVALKQAAAAVGQTTLMRAYEKAFEKRDRKVGQLLLTHEDFEDRQRYLNARGTLETLLSHGIVPVVNENDTVATEEIRLGDNDMLAALLAQMVRADLLILLTEPDGLYTKDPRVHPDAQRIPVLERIDDDVVRIASGRNRSSVGTGGMASKLAAARVVSAWGTPVIIASGFARRSILDALEGKDVGTLVLPRGTVKARSRKMWIAHARHPLGSITVDEGARRVLLEGGKSLLPAGVVAVEGTFRAGDAVSVCDRKGRIFARGISSWDSERIEQGKGRKTPELARLMGDGLPPEVIHRDNMTILPAPKASPETRKGVPTP